MKQLDLEYFIKLMNAHVCSAWGYGGSIKCKGCEKEYLCNSIDFLLKKLEEKGGD